ncbi:mitochondrial fission ELM1 family protein [Hyphobacterium marinum]|uniref:Mitochondrial fission ELM1 family protein n=1 Tax=Hyphobacterium marinum TaxID=3116574 RepID=A0ABU7LXV6_9PROT|nr:mitochondrial fission ELM1 family protein [Hyphobacterium sp. Y6023]MEE2566117.1 mitochondrial fission ELM1 family protein [Hyphobacterium sp. Y6023]
MASDSLKIWAVADTRRGVENQAIGLAEAVAARTDGQMSRVTIGPDGFAALPDSAAPDIWIGCGRPAIRLARQQRRAFANSVFVYVQDPRTSYEIFDLIVAPRHDRLDRGNAVATTGSPHRVTAGRLADEAERFSERLNGLPGPRAAVLVGGPSKAFRMGGDVEGYLAGRIDDLLAQDLTLMVSVSRRTPASLRQRLKVRLKDEARCWFHDGDGDNPYFAFLASADWIFVTEDSTNMLTEAAATGTPVYSLPLSGKAGKFALLHAGLEAHGALRPFLGRLDTWTYPPLDETTRIARLIADVHARRGELR